MKVNSILLILCLIMVFGFTACSGDAGTVQTADVSVIDTETEAETTTSGPTLDLPQANNNGKTFSILTTVHAAYEYDAEEHSGDVVEDAVYMRNTAVEELLGINFNFIYQPGHWADRAAFNTSIKTSVMAGDGAYDLVNAVILCVLPTAVEGLFIDVNELDWVDLDKPWWVQNMYDDLAVGNKLFCFVGDSSLSLYKDLSVIYFNKKLAEDYSIEDPYQLVRNGSWTFDKFYSLFKQVSGDLNGDGAFTHTDDLFGFVFHAVPMRAFQTSTEFTVVDFDENDNPYIVDLSERDATTFTKLFDMIQSSDNIWGENVVDHVNINNVFTSDRTLFLAQFLYTTEALRDMESDFGIVPFPKREEVQDKYYTQIGTSTSYFFVPVTTNDITLTSQVCEALSYYSHNGVVPAYYDVALKEKYTRDNDVKEMLELIRSSAVMDFTFAYSTMFTPFINTITPTELNQSGDIASRYDANKEAWQGVIDNLLEDFEALE